MGGFSGRVAGLQRPALVGKFYPQKVILVIFRAIPPPLRNKRWKKVTATPLPLPLQKFLDPHMFRVICTENNHHTLAHSLIPNTKPPGANTYRGETTTPRCTTPPSDVSLHDLFASVTFLHSSSFYIRVRSFCSGYLSFCYRVFLFCIQLFISWLRPLVLQRSPFVLQFLYVLWI